jgi:hypothetical protein
MPSNTAPGQSRGVLASVLRLLCVPVALVVLFHAEPVTAVSPVVVSIAAQVDGAAVDAGVSAEAELPMCDLADASLVVAPGSCLAAIPDGEIPQVGASAAQGGAANAPADRPPADRAAPMCDPNAMSISAPVEIPEIDRGRFEPLPCDGQALLSLLRSQHRESGIQLVNARESLPRAPVQPPSLNDGNDGAAAFSGPLCWPERASPSTLAAHRRGGLAWQPGHRSRIDRPPSRRA